MFTTDPMSLLSQHHREHATLIAKVRQASGRAQVGPRERLSAAYYVAVRRAYLRARAARVAASRVTL